MSKDALIDKMLSTIADELLELELWFIANEKMYGSQEYLLKFKRAIVLTNIKKEANEYRNNKTIIQSGGQDSSGGYTNPEFICGC